MKYLNLYYFSLGKKIRDRDKIVKIAIVLMVYVQIQIFQIESVYKSKIFVNECMFD